MGCCTSCFLYTTEYDYIDDVELQRDLNALYVRRSMQADLQAQYDREKADGVVFIPAHTTATSYEFGVPVRDIVRAYSTHSHHLEHP